MRDRLFADAAAGVARAYDAGIFTEFMEQRAPGHTVLDDKIYRQGLLDFKRDIADAIAALDFPSDPEAYAKREQLQAMDIACDAVDPLRRAPRGRWRDRAAAAEEIPPAARSWGRSPTSATACRPTPRATSTRPCNPTGSATWR